MLTLEKLLRIYEMPPGRGGQSGNRGGGSSGKGGGSSGRGGGSSSSRGSGKSGATQGNIGAKTGGSKSSGRSGGNNNTRGGAYSASTSRAQNRAAPSTSKSSVSGATRGNISAKTKNTPTSSSRGGPPIGTNPAASTLAARQAAVDAANAKRAANPSVPQGLKIDIKSRDAPVTAGIDEPGANLTGSHSPGIDAAPALDTDSYNFSNTKDDEGGLLSKIGDGFRQMAIDVFGAEPGIEGYDKDGNYGYGLNSSYGQQLLGRSIQG